MADTCANCHVGHLKRARAVFVQGYGDTLVHAPNIPAWKCDICGETSFDLASLHCLEILIGDAGPPPNRYVAPVSDSRPADPETNLPTSPPLRPPSK